VPEGVIREILDAARWAPSWRNTQAWSVWVLSGDALQRYKDEFRAAVERDDPAALDLSPTMEWPQACSARTAALMKSRAATLEAAGEPADPAAALARMADLFGAPCLLVFGLFDDTDMARAKKIMGARQCIGGNVPGSLLAMGEPAQVDAYVKDLLGKVAGDGGFLLGTGVVLDEAKPENFRAFINAGRKYGADA